MRTLFLLSFVFLLGCTQSPPELRDLVPVAITVTDGDTPLSLVRVTLSTTEPDSRIWGCGGVTDARGRADITSSMQSHVATGAAPGTYKVILAESMTLPPELESTEVDGAIPDAKSKALAVKREAWIKEHRVIPAAFETAETTPRELVVEPGKKTTLTVDVSEHRP